MTPLNRRTRGVPICGREMLDSYRHLLTWAFGGEPPMRFLTMSNAPSDIPAYLLESRRNVILDFSIGNLVNGNDVNYRGLLGYGARTH